MKSEKGFAEVLIVVGVFIVIGIGWLYWYGYDQDYSIVTPAVTPTVIELSVTPTKVPTNTPVSEDTDIEKTKSFWNPSKKVRLKIYNNSRDSTDNVDGWCPVSLVNSEDATIEGVLDFSTVECASSGYAYSRQFHGWAGDNHLLFEFDEGTINTYSLEDDSSLVFNYDSDIYRYQAVNKDLSVWLFAIKDGQDISLFDSSGEVIQENIFLGGQDSELWSIDYDYVNNGFFMIYRKFEYPDYPEGVVEYKFYWLDENNLELSLIDRIGSEVSGGRGCLGGEYTPEVGFAVYQGLDCFVLPQEYFEFDELRFVIP